MKKLNVKAGKWHNAIIDPESNGNKSSFSDVSESSSGDSSENESDDNITYVTNI